MKVSPDRCVFVEVLSMFQHPFANETTSVDQARCFIPPGGPAVPTRDDGSRKVAEPRENNETWRFQGCLLFASRPNKNNALIMGRYRYKYDI